MKRYFEMDVDEYYDTAIDIEFEDSTEVQNETLA